MKELVILPHIHALRAAGFNMEPRVHMLPTHMSDRTIDGWCPQFQTDILVGCRKYDRVTIGGAGFSRRDYTNFVGFAKAHCLRDGNSPPSFVMEV
jgi:hypothetical protein